MGTLVGIALCVGNKRAVATAPAESEPTGIMTFADPAMQALCAQTWGDGTNITYEQAREVTEIPKNWAKGNTTITSFNEIKYFKNCRTIGGFAFQDCKSMALTKLELPQCTSIGNSAFYNCSSMALTSLDLPQCTAIGGSAFKGCSSMALTKLELPLCTSIGGSAFNGCPLLSEITFQNVTTVGTQAFIGSTIAKIKLPSVETMAASSNYEGIFSYCKNLVLVDLGENCSSIGNESLGRYVGTSGNIITIICRASTPPSLGGTIINKGWVFATIGEIYVPDKSVEAYKTATNWSAYANKILPLSQYKG